MKNYLRNWNFMRVFRLALGVIVMVQGIMANEWLMAGLGALFALMPLMNVGSLRSKRMQYAHCEKWNKIRRNNV